MRDENQRLHDWHRNCYQRSNLTTREQKLEQVHQGFNGRP